MQGTEKADRQEGVLQWNRPPSPSWYQGRGGEKLDKFSDSSWGLFWPMQNFLPTKTWHKLKTCNKKKIWPELFVEFRFWIFLCWSRNFIFLWKFLANFYSVRSLTFLSRGRNWEATFAAKSDGTEQARSQRGFSQWRTPLSHQHSRKHGSNCGTVVEHSDRDPKVMGSYPAGYLVFFSSFSFFLPIIVKVS